MVEPGYDPNFEPEDPRNLNPEAEAIDAGPESFHARSAPEEAQEPAVEIAPEAEAEAEIQAKTGAETEAEPEVEVVEEAIEATGPGIFARVLSVAMAAASFAAVRGAGLVYNYPRAALAMGLSVVVLGGVLMVRSGDGGKAPVARIPAPEAPGDKPENPVKTVEAKPEAVDRHDEPEETLDAPETVADLAEPAPAIEAESAADDQFPAIDAVKLTSGASSFDLPALPELGEDAPAPAPTIALASANLKLGEDPEDAPPPPAPSLETETDLDEADTRPAPAPDFAPDLAPDPDPAPEPDEDEREPAPAPDLDLDSDPTPAPALEPNEPNAAPGEDEDGEEPAPAPDLDPIADPDPAPSLDEDHGLLEIPSLDDPPATPAVDPTPKPEPKPEPATDEPPQMMEPKSNKSAAIGLGAGLGAAVGALTGSAIGDRDDEAGIKAKPVEPWGDLDQAPLPPVEPDEPLAEPTPSQEASTDPDDLPVFRAVPSPSPPAGLDAAEPPAPDPDPDPDPTPAPSSSVSMDDEAGSADELDMEGWVPVKRSPSAAYMLRDIDRDEPYLDDFGPRGHGPNPAPDAHADKAMEFEIHQPFRDEPRAPAPAPADDDGGMDTVLHRVEPGENFWTISRTYYTSGRYYRALGQANADQFERLEDLYVGAVIRVPPPEDLDPDYIDPPPSRAARNQNPLVSETNSRASGVDDDWDPDAVPIRRAGRSELELHLPIADPRAERASDEPSRDARRADEPEFPTRRPVSRPVHKVRPRETLRTIARDRLGDARRADEILQLNRQVIDDPHRLTIGQVLDLPEDARANRVR